MPPSDKPIANFISISAGNGGGSVDSCSLGMSSIAPNVFTTLTVGSGAVQTTKDVSFNLVLSMALMQTDELQISFSSAFTLSAMSTTGSVAVSGLGSFSMTRIGSLIKLTPSISQPISNATLPFTLSNITLPFSVASAPIYLSLLTYDNYYRINQTYLYQANPGVLTASVSCLSYEIGVSTSCLFSITTSSALYSDAVIEFVFDSSFPILDGSSTCTLTGTNLVSSTACTSFSSTSTIRAININSTNANFPAMNLTVNLSMTASRAVGAHAVAVRSLAGGSVVDAGSVTITTVARGLNSG